MRYAWVTVFALVLYCLVMSSYRQEWFVDEVMHDYICPICSDVCHLPVNCTGGHVFCQSCLRQSSLQSMTCPVDRRPISALDIEHINGFVQKQIWAYKIRCPNMDNGCQTVIGAIGTDERNLLNHRQVCQFENASCEKCNITVLRRDMTEHLLNQCDFRLMECPICHESVVALEYDEHTMVPSHCANAVYCPNACTIAENGITTIILKNNLDAHYKTCPLQSMQCTICDVILPRSHLERHNETNQLLHLQYLASVTITNQTVNEHLRADLKEQRTVIQSLRTEVDELRSALVMIKEKIVATPGIGITIFRDVIEKNLLYSDNLYQEIRKIHSDNDRQVFQAQIKALMELIHDDSPLLMEYTIQKKEVALEVMQFRQDINVQQFWAVRDDDYQFLIAQFPHLKSMFDVNKPFGPKQVYDNKGNLLYQLYPISGGMDRSPYTGLQAMPIPNAKQITVFDRIPHITRREGTQIIILYRETSMAATSSSSSNRASMALNNSSQRGRRRQSSGLISRPSTDPNKLDMQELKSWLTELEVIFPIVPKPIQFYIDKIYETLPELEDDYPRTPNHDH